MNFKNVMIILIVLLLTRNGFSSQKQNLNEYFGYLGNTLIYTAVFGAGYGFISNVPREFIVKNRYNKLIDFNDMWYIITSSFAFGSSLGVYGKKRLDKRTFLYPYILNNIIIFSLDLSEKWETKFGMRYFLTIPIVTSIIGYSLDKKYQNKNTLSFYPLIKIKKNQIFGSIVISF